MYCYSSFYNCYKIIDIFLRKKVNFQGQSVMIKIHFTLQEKIETENTCKSLMDGSNGKNDLQEVDKSIPALPRNDVEVFLQGLSTGT